MTLSPIRCLCSRTHSALVFQVFPESCLLMLFRAQSGALLVSSVCYSEGKSSKGTMFLQPTGLSLEGDCFHCSHRTMSSLPRELCLLTIPRQLCLVRESPSSKSTLCMVPGFLTFLISSLPVHSRKSVLTSLAHLWWISNNRRCLLCLCSFPLLMISSLSLL